MSENVLQTAQSLIQDVIAPDVRELKVRTAALEKDLEALRKHIDHSFESLEKNMDRRFADSEKSNDRRFVDAEKRSELQFKALLAAISENRMQVELSSARVLASLSERVALLEARRQ